MIIKITQAEVRKLVAQRLNLSYDSFTVEITDCAPSASKQASEIIIALRNATVEFPLHHSSQKIACIKRFRELAPRVVGGEPGTNGWGLSSVVGLSDAKWAVENVAVAIRNLELTGTLRPL